MTARAALGGKAGLVTGWFGRAGAVALALVALLAVLPGIARATPTFLSAVNLSDAGQDGFEPEVAVDSAGNILTVWTRSDGANTRIQAMMRTPTGSFGTIETISDPGQSASEPTVAFDPSGNAIAVWSRFDGANTRVQSAFRPVGGSFDVPETLSAAGQSADQPQIGFDSAGNAIAVWERSDGTKLRIEAATRLAGGSFSVAQVLSEAGQDAFEPQVAPGTNMDSTAALVWTRFDGAKLRVQSSRRRDVPGFARPRGATPVRASLVPAYTACVGGNRSHGAPLSVGSCAPPTQSSSVLTIGTLDANGFASNSTGFALLAAMTGNANNNVDDADVRVTLSITDVRNKPSGTDYAGRVLLRLPVQITDKNNAAETPEPATTEATALNVPGDCVATVETNVGGTCAASTTLDSLVPGTVVEGQRSIWALGQIEVKDAGPNGTGYAACPPTCGDGDEAVFMRQGIFVP
jgi:hypothetical protein